MSAPIIVSRVRATLHRQGYQGFTQDQILDAAKTLNIDVDNPTPEETKAVVNSLKKLSEPISVLNVNEEDLTPKISEEINHDQLKSLPSEKFEIVSHKQKNQMVRHQAELMNVQVSDADVEVIVTKVDSQKTNTQELNQEIRAAISAYIQHRKKENLEDVQIMFSDIVQEQNQANQEVSEAISQGLKQFAKDLEVANEATKSSVRGALRFPAIPKNPMENQA